MEELQRESLKGTILTQWIDDLAAGRSLQPAPDAAALSAKEVDDLIDLAYWWISHTVEPRPQTMDLDNLVDRVAHRLSLELAKQEAVEELLQRASSFGAAIGAAVELIGVPATRIEQGAHVRPGTLAELISERMPAHRLSVDQMVQVLAPLHLLRSAVVDLVRDSCVRWLDRSFGSPHAALGRIDGMPEDRERVLADAASRDRESRATELMAINALCAGLIRAVAR